MEGIKETVCSGDVMVRDVKPDPIEIRLCLTRQAIAAHGSGGRRLARRMRPRAFNHVPKSSLVVFRILPPVESFQGRLKFFSKLLEAAFALTKQANGFSH